MCSILTVLKCCLVSLVGKVPVYSAGGLGSIPGWANTLVPKILEDAVTSAPLLRTALYRRYISIFLYF